jgi:hypothetical protein
MPREGGASSIPRLPKFTATPDITGSPAFAGDDNLRDAICRT